MSGVFRIIVKTLVLAALVALLVYTGWFHMFTLFVWQHPMLTWLPVLAFFGVGYLLGTIKLAQSAREARSAPTPMSMPMEGLGGQTPDEPAYTEPTAGPGAPVPSGGIPHPPRPRRAAFAYGWAFLAFCFILVIGLVTTLFSPPRVPLDELDYEVVDKLPATTQPRLLPRTSVNDDPNFRDTKEIHLVRDRKSGELLWTGEWQSSFFTGPSSGVSVKNLDTIQGESTIVRSGFDHSVAGHGPGTVNWESNIKHPFSKVQYPVIAPGAEGQTAIAISPYVGYQGFPFKTPFFKGVIVYHQDGTVEDLTPEEAAERPELVASGRIYPEAQARADAESLADEIGGEIKDADGNQQHFLTSIDDDTTAWVTVINEGGAAGKVAGVVIQDSSTGEIDLWEPQDGEELVSTRFAIDSARALPLQWETTRCCDSEGHSYTVKLREVVEPRLAFKDGKAYYLVTVAPTSDLALSREVEYTLLIDAESGKTLQRFDHASDPNADNELTTFFRR